MDFGLLKLSTVFSIFLALLRNASGFYDMGTTTLGIVRTDKLPRQSFFRWQRTEHHGYQLFFWWWDWDDIFQRRRLCYVGGVSIDFLTLGTATILNRRTMISSENFLNPYINRQRDIRVWALGRTGEYNTPYRYRVWKVTRVFPRSLNHEHWHGPRGIHQPRHDIAVLHTMDQMYIYYIYPTRYMYAFRATLTGKHDILPEDLWFHGSGYEYLEHIFENYKITYGLTKRSLVVDCSKYLPKWWGKFICIINHKSLTGIQNGGGLFGVNTLYAIGCFEIRYNEDRIFVFTDIRYYIDWINVIASIQPGEYYEYAYPQWGQKLDLVYDQHWNFPYIPKWQIQRDLFPLGK